MGNQVDIKSLDSNRVFYYFEEISKIPRGSFNEKAISEYLVEFAKSHGLECRTDELFNVVIKKPATSGYENAPIVAIQGHTDMVCEKNKGVEHDFEKDAIKIIYDGDLIKADRTTLGADNGVAVAMALAILESSNLSHPAIESIFTSCEEVGMDGAMGLDISDLKASIFLNIDSEDEGVFTVGCAGGAKGDLRLALEYQELENIGNYKTYCLSISGLMGGHSGIDINVGRGNSNKLLGRALNNIKESGLNIYMSGISGGSKDNAIPREAEAIILIENTQDLVEKLNSKVNEFNAIFKDEYANTDENLVLKLEELSGSSNKVFSDDVLNKVIGLLVMLPNGVQTMNTDIQGLVESSLNIGVVRMLEDQDMIEIVCAVRSGKSSKKLAIMEHVDLTARMLGASIKFRGNYPAWEYNKNSKIREICKDVYKQVSGEEAKVEIIHAGLECGLFYEKMPTLDLISYGPNLHDIHTPDERASISSIDRVYNFTLKLLEAIK
ncbi:MAG: aminoacyl-histidine dipeptidase [bacterium]